MTSTSWRIFPASNERRMLEKIDQWQIMTPEQKFWCGFRNSLKKCFIEKNIIFIFFSSTRQPEKFKTIEDHKRHKRQYWFNFLDLAKIRNHLRTQSLSDENWDIRCPCWWAELQALKIRPLCIEPTSLQCWNFLTIYGGQEPSRNRVLAPASQAA